MAGPDAEGRSVRTVGTGVISAFFFFFFYSLHRTGAVSGGGAGMKEDFNGTGQMLPVIPEAYSPASGSTPSPPHSLAHSLALPFDPLPYSLARTPLAAYRRCLAHILERLADKTNPMDDFPSHMESVES